MSEQMRSSLRICVRVKIIFSEMIKGTTQIIKGTEQGNCATIKKMQCNTEKF